MNIIEKLQYGTKEDTNKDFLYIDKIVIQNYNNPSQVKLMMKMLGTEYTFYQFNNNGKKAIECDYFFWQYVGEDGKENWQSVDLSYYKHDIYGVYAMQSLLDMFKDNYTDVDVIVYYKDIRQLVKEIEMYDNANKHE